MSMNQQRRRWLGAMPGVVLLAFAMGAGSVAQAAVDVVPAGPLLSTKAIAYQFAVYLPEKPPAPPMEALRQALKATAGAPTLTQKLDEPPKNAVVMATLNEKVATTYAPPDADQVQRFGRGLSKEQAAALARSRSALIMDFAHPSAQRMSAYRSSLLIAEQVARATGGLLWDEETREVFTPDAWHARRLESWERDVPDVMQQIVIHAYRGERQVRAISLGMGKFGAPDVVIDNFPWSSNAQMGNLINAMAQLSVEGASIGANGQFDLDFAALRHPRIRDALQKQLLPNAKAKAPLLLVKGTPEEGDPRNRLIEIRFDRASGKDDGARQDALLGALYGSKDGISRITHNEALEAASQAAKAKLPGLRDAFNKGLAPGAFIMVKAPFATPSGGREWMWVEVSAWQGDAITGLLKNEPADIPDLHGGQTVKVSQRDVFDYLLRDASGRSEGNETAKIIAKMR